VFAERGLEATLDDVAHHAGLGVGTAYRHFPNKHALIEGLYDDRLAEFISFAETALAEPDPWVGLSSAMIRLAEDLAEVKGLRDLMLHGTPMKPPSAAADLDRVMGALLERAQAHGSVRPDLTITDLPILMAMTDAAAERDPEHWRLFQEVLLNGLTVPPTTPA